MGKAFSIGFVTAIAMACHAANAAWCEYGGDTSQKPWAEAPDWQRDSAIVGVEFHLANPDAGDAASHERWMEHKLAAGWKFGAVKDEKKKTHPCLVPFDQLPPEQQFKDRLFRTLVHATAGGFGPLADEDEGQILLLTTQMGKIAAAIVALGYEPQPYSDEYSPADHIIGLLSEAKDKVGELESKLGAATAKVETLEGKLDKLANPKAPKKKRAVMLALADKAPTALEAALTGATSLVFSEEGGQIDDIKPIELSPADFRKDGGRALLTRRIEIDRDAAFVRIDHAWLIADGKPVAKCEIPGGLPAGNGRAAMFDSGHLIFG